MWKLPAFDEFIELIRQVHKLDRIQFTVWYTDPEGDLLPISNKENFARALTTAQPLLRVVVLRKSKNYTPLYNFLEMIFQCSSPKKLLLSYVYKSLLSCIFSKLNSTDLSSYNCTCCSQDTI